ncbi:MAG TPA: hypothetical protein VFZ09_27385 [Archangium sp.]|uniref:hypothetical protein n=1 Tax=Archangium sp. TaxID=1872627 RepID=UPI002E2F8937|nr:hypothetical protein [Archangium sp.]HEX5749983.1 hypothetical protein [Archangium sp.]
MPRLRGLMAITRQSDSFLPERDPGVHEYRASLLSVFLHTDPRGDASLALPPEMQPLPLSEAIELIHQLPGGRTEEALATAEFKLASAVLVEQRDEFIHHLANLLGVEVGDPAAFRRALTESIQETVPGQIPGRFLSYDDIRNFAYRGLANPAPTEPPPPTEQTPVPPLVYPVYPTRERGLRKALLQVMGLTAKTPTPPEEARVRSAPQAARFLTSRPESTVDLETLVTTVDIPSESRCDFALLARTLDPRSWGPSPFWPECFQVEPTPDGRGFVPVPAAKATLRGTDWHGALFEHVEWNWNTFRAASFRNFLNIDYTVDEPHQTIDMRFSLFSCEGSELFVVSFDRGIDVDAGFQTVAPIPNPRAGGPRFQLRTVKNIRYSDLLDRRTRPPAALGSGQILSHLAPVVVGLWMNELVKKLYC